MDGRSVQAPGIRTAAALGAAKAQEPAHKFRQQNGLFENIEIPQANPCPQYWD